RFTCLFLAVVFSEASGQVPPSETELQRYTGLHRAAARGEVALIKPGNVDLRDSHGRTPLHVAAFRAQHDAMRALVAAGANPNALENDRYDIVTIAAVANDAPTLKLALARSRGYSAMAKLLEARKAREASSPASPRMCCTTLRPSAERA